MPRVPPSHFALTLLTLTLSGCGNDNDAVRVTVIGDSASPFESGTRLSLSGQLVRAATAEGLVGFDDQGRVIPALADRWIITDDGLSYIFRLRGGTWRDGSPITGETVKTALNQNLTSLRGTSLALALSDIADIRSMAGRVVEIRLTRPSPDFLQLLAQPELGLFHQAKGAGPFALKRSGQNALLTPIPPEKRGLPSPDDSDQTTRKINLTAVSGKLATAQFSNAKVDLVLGGTFADYPRISRLALGKNKPRLDPVTGLFGLSLTHTNGLLSNPTARQAIAMAIDREAIASALSAPTYISTTRLLPPGIADDSGQVDERWTGKSMAERQQSASAIIARWITAKHHNANLTLALPTGPGADLLYNRLKTDLGQISITLTRVSDNAPADLRLIDTVARYARSAWFLHQLDCTANRGPCTASADRLAARANLAETPKKSTDLAAQAEALHLQNNVYIPLGTPIRWSLVGTKINTFTVNRWGQHPLPTLATTRK